jgi:hypothetical protein
LLDVNGGENISSVADPDPTFQVVMNPYPPGKISGVQLSYYYMTGVGAAIVFSVRKEFEEVYEINRVHCNRSDKDQFRRGMLWIWIQQNSAVPQHFRK